MQLTPSFNNAADIAKDEEDPTRDVKCTTKAPRHLFVLIHGFMGGKADFDPFIKIAKSFLDESNSVYVHSIGCNSTVHFICVLISLSPSPSLFIIIHSTNLPLLFCFVLFRYLDMLLNIL